VSLRDSVAYDTAVSDEIKKHRFRTVEQVAEELNVSVSQIRALLKAGDLRGTHLQRVTKNKDEYAAGTF
jgi:ribosomal protein S25